MTDMNQDKQATYAAIDAWIDQHFDEEVKFLQAMVQVPTDTPPGNNAPHAERTADLFCRICNDCLPSYLAAEERARALGWIDDSAPAATAAPPTPADEQDDQ